jgi:hypothetical protein
VVITVAEDKSPDDARPWIEAARPTHPSLIDPTHRLADLYNMVNVPTIVWIDGAGRIVRPNDVAFGVDRFKEITGIDPAVHLGRLRAWVRGETPALPPERARELQAAPDAAQQQARAHFGLGEWLFQQGQAEAAARQFAIAGELAPHDFMIRRGSMPMRGADPMGPEFGSMVQEWTGAGHSYYHPLPE